MNDKKLLGQRIKWAREFKVLSTNDLAAMMETDYSLISRWESGTIKPREKTIKRLAEVLEVNPSWLAHGTKDLLKYVEEREKENE